MYKNYTVIIARYYDFEHEIKLLVNFSRSLDSRSILKKCNIFRAAKNSKIKFKMSFTTALKSQMSRN